MTTEDYVSFEVAKLLKEKGFNGDTASCYILEDSTHHIMSDKVTQSEYYESQDSNEHGHLIQAPTLQMAMKWLREVHNIHIVIKIVIRTYGDTEYYYELYGTKNKSLCVVCDIYKGETWSRSEAACEEAIKYCLENLI